MKTVVDALSRKEQLEKLFDFSARGRIVKAKKESLMAEYKQREEALVSEFKEKEKAITMEDGEISAKLSEFLAANYGFDPKAEMLLTDMFSKIVSNT